MKTLSDTVVLEGKVTPDDVRECLIEAVNLGWHTGGNDGRASVPANFVAWMLQENGRLRQCLDQACRQWRLYAELQEDRDLATEQTVEGVLYRKCVSASPSLFRGVP